MKKLLLIAMITVSAGCANDNFPMPQANLGDYLIFGDYYGMCLGPRCVRMFRLSGNSLFEDSNKTYPSTQRPYDGNFSIDRSDRFDEVKDLRAKIPAALTTAEEKVLGCPDCSDGGGMYIETQVDGELRYWLIDLQRVPAGLEDFVSLVEQKIAILE